MSLSYYGKKLIICLLGRRRSEGSSDRRNRGPVRRECGHRRRGGHTVISRQLAAWHNGFVLDADVFKALASEKRLQILEWLRDPELHFPPQQDGDLVKDGVCSLFIADKLGVSQPTCGEHLRVLSRAGLVRGKKIKQWVFYQRDENRIRQLKRDLREGL